MPSKNNSMLQVKINGAAELARALTDLGNDRTIKAVLKRALNNRSTKRMLEYAKSLAPKHSQRMAKNLAISTTLSRRQRRQQRSDRGWGGGKTSDDRFAVLYIGATPKGPAVLEEFGTKQRQHKSGKGTGAGPSQPFMRPAWETFKDAILKEFEAELGAGIEKAAKRIARKQAKLIREGRA